MMDRSSVMRAVGSVNTKPEMIVRRLAHALGYRYGLHRKDLAGRPDLVFSARRKVIFVHGCFWHGHNCKRGARIPRTSRAYWTKKIARNRERDVKVAQELRVNGWRVLTIWECELKNTASLGRRLVRFLD
jgi:DNA mismatch endonuclease, patch repair protein